jgi:uncharacterized damage-inducible protein DinB
MTQNVLINSAYVRTMAAYNAEMNRRVYGAAERLSDFVRRKDCGAFWGSIHGTFNHILWADQVWMARFDHWPKPTIAQKQSPMLFADFTALQRERAAADAKISEWAERVSEDWLSADQVWFSGSAGKEMSMPRGLLVTHFFNHQTHHRGQAHALITAAGEQTGDTDLFLVI